MSLRRALRASILILCAAGCGADGPDGGLDAAADAHTPPIDAPAATDTGSTTGDAPGIDVPRGDSGPPRAVPVVWFSDWRNGTGTGRSALYDGDKWTGQLCGADVAEVVPAAGLDFPTTNVYRSEYSMPSLCLMVQTQGLWSAPAVGEYFFLRAYYRNEIPDGEVVGLPHPIHIGRTPTGYTTWFNFPGPTDGAVSMILQLGGGPPYPDRYWAYPFRTFETHRIELRMHRATDATATIDVRVYDSAGALVAEADDFHNGEGGMNSRTLAESAPVFPVTAESFTLIELGNNDPAGLVAGTNRYVYWGALAVVVSADPEAWPGPYPTEAEAAP